MFDKECGDVPLVREMPSDVEINRCNQSQLYEYTFSLSNLTNWMSNSIRLNLN